MSSLTPAQEAEMRALAEKATAGPWTFRWHTTNTHGTGDFSIYGLSGTAICFEGEYAKDGDPAYIAAANPAAVIALLDELAAARGIVDLAKEMIVEMRLTPDGLIVREKADKSDAHYRLCSLLWPRPARAHLATPADEGEGR